MEPKFLREKQLMKLFQVSRTAINQWRKKGMPHVIIGHIVMYPVKEVIGWITHNSNCNFNELVFERILKDILRGKNGNGE